MTYPDTEKLAKLVVNAERIVVLQADNPDADSLGSALALESILGDLGKEVTLYSAVDMPTYLRYMPGWDRVEKELPNKFDLSIIVDASTSTLFEALEKPSVCAALGAKPCIILDHHTVTDHPIPFATITINDGDRASAGELIYIISRDLQWSVSKTAGEYIASSILGDTQGLSNELAGPETYRIMAELIELGVNRPELEDLRREYGKMPEQIFRYKAQLIDRTELYEDGALAIVVIPQEEINTYSPLYNPAPLIQNDILQTKGVQLAVVLKKYDTGRITAAIRANSGFAVAGQLAEYFGGGGHKYAAGFKITDGKPFNEVKSECINKASELLKTVTE
jgi:bifunctional oligoribonuclease and PAP phosphatase NrnA